MEAWECGYSMMMEKTIKNKLFKRICLIVFVIYVAMIFINQQKTINSYFDPKDATGNQAEQKNTGTTLAEIVNSTIGNFTEMKASESERLADFVLSNIDEIIYSNFIQFINVYGEIPEDSDFNCWGLRK